MKKYFLLCAMLLSALSLSAQNLLPGDTSFEADSGYFNRVWFGHGVPFGFSEENGAPMGMQYADVVVPAGQNYSYSGSKIPMTASTDYVFSFWVKADQPIEGSMISVHTAWNDTQFHKFAITDEWQRVALPFQVLKNEDYWIVLDFDNTKNNQDSHVSFDGVQLEKGTVPTAFQGEKALLTGMKLYSEFNKIFFDDEKPVAQLMAKDFRGDEPLDTTLLVVVTDYRQQEVARWEEPVAWKGIGFKKEFALPVSQYGLFTVRSKWMDAAGTVLDEQMDSYAVVQKPLPDDPDVEPYLGVNSGTNFGISRIGVRWQEVDLWWRTLEPTPGNPQYDELLERLKSLKERGFRTKLSLVHLPGTPAWVHRPEEVAEAKSWGLTDGQAFFPTDEALATLPETFAELIRRAGDTIDLLEIGGEDELISGSEPYYLRKYPEHVHFGHVHGPVTRDLAAITSAYIKGAKMANPNLRIAAGRPSGGSPAHADFAFSRDVLTQVEGDFQFFPMDCYSFRMRYLDPRNMPNIGSANREYPAVFQHANEMTHTYLQGQKPFVSEYGYAIDNRLAPDHPLQQEEAGHMLSAVLTAKLLGSPFFFWFNSYGCVESKYFDYGLWHDDTPMLLIPAMSQVIRVVEGVHQYDSRLGSPESNLKLGLFGQRDRAYLAFWTDHGENPVRFALPEDAKVLNFAGNAAEMPADGLYTAGILAKYIVLDGPDAYEILHRVMETAEDDAMNLTAKLFLNDAKTAVLSVIPIDPAVKSQNVSCEYAFDDETKKSIAKDDAAAFPWQLALEIPEGASTLTVTLKEGEGHSHTDTLSLAATRLANGKCLLAEFGDARKDIIPPDPWIRWDGRKDLGGAIAVECTDESIILTAEISDDVNRNNQRNERLWDGDCFQFALNPVPTISLDKMPVPLGSTDVEFGLALTSRGPEAVCFTGNYNAEMIPGTDFQILRDDEKGVTSYRIALSRKVLNLDRPGQRFRLGCVVFDDDEGTGQSYYYQTSPGITGSKNMEFLQLLQLP